MESGTIQTIVPARALPYYPPGSIIARRYVVLRALGRGAAGAVYLCHEPGQPQNRKAIKILSARLADDATLLARFYREGKVAREIKSPYVVRSYDLIMDDGIFAYTMEYVEGRSLGDFLDDNPKPDASFVYRCLKEIALGLRAIHMNDMVHRDLKPHNVLLTDDNHCKITDFGVVHLVREWERQQAGHAKPPRRSSGTFERPEERHLTRVGELIGTTDYLSPEYIQKGRLDERSDLYALGVLAFVMLAGRPPFEGKTMEERLEARVRHPAPELAGFRADIPDPICALVMRCLDRNPMNRPQSAEEFLAELEIAIPDA